MPRNRAPHVRLIRLPLDTSPARMVGHTSVGLYVDTTAREDGKATPDRDRLLMTYGQAERLAKLILEALPDRPSPNRCSPSCTGALIIEQGPDDDDGCDTCEIQRCDACARFETDEDAAGYVNAVLREAARLGR